MRVFLIDDHQLFRSGVRHFLEAVPEAVLVGEAGDAVSALAMTEETCPDVLVVDVHLPDMDGIALACQIRERLPAVKMVFLSSDTDFAVVRRALLAGASGYVLKANAPEELRSALRAARDGGVFLCPELVAALVADYGRLAAEKEKSPRPLLSEREVAVLRLTAQGRSTKEIASQFGLSTKTIDTYRSRLVAKLGLRATADLVRYAIREGLVNP